MAATGPIAPLQRYGWYVAIRRGPPSKQGTEVPRREAQVAGGGESFARAKRDLTPGVTARATVEFRTALSRGRRLGLVTSWRRRPQQWGRWVACDPPTAAWPQAITHGEATLAPPRSSSSQHRKTNFFFPCMAELAGRNGPRRSVRGGRGRSANITTDCAVGSG